MLTTNIPDEMTEIACNTMQEHHLETEFTAEAQHQAETLQEAHHSSSSHMRDMREMLWFSVDNEDSKDLDQLTYAEQLPDGHYKIYVAIADVDTLVKKGSPIDQRAQKNTTSVYTPTKVFSMLPERLSTDLTSLKQGAERLAIVVEVEVGVDGSEGSYRIYRAIVRNHAKLAYPSLANALEEKTPMPSAVIQVKGLEQQIRLQDSIAQLLKSYRNNQGALTLEVIEPQPEIQENRVVDIKITEMNRAKELIEEFMILANMAVAQFFKEHHQPSLRRVVRTPKRWDRIVEIAQEKGETLPIEPNSKALDLFLIKERLLSRDTFPDLSLTIIKLLGRGEYIVAYPHTLSPGHFSLALKDYTHFTAPNRRFPDLVSQRILKATLENRPSPYSSQELEQIAQHCTSQEDVVTKVERKMKKSASILLLENRIGEAFQAIVTGASEKGVWVRLFHPPVEGKLVRGGEKVDVGDKLTVTLTRVDLEKGFIDFIATDNKV